MTRPVDSPLLSVGGAAARLGVSSDTVLRWTREGKLPYIRTAGGHRRYHPADIDAAREAMGRKVANGG